MYYYDEEEDLVHTVHSFIFHGEARALCGASVLAETHKFYMRFPATYLQCKVCAERDK